MPFITALLEVASAIAEGRMGFRLQLIENM